MANLVSSFLASALLVLSEDCIGRRWSLLYIVHCVQRPYWLVIFSTVKSQTWESFFGKHFGQVEEEQRSFAKAGRLEAFPNLSQVRFVHAAYISPYLCVQLGRLPNYWWTVLFSDSSKYEPQMGVLKCSALDRSFSGMGLLTGPNQPSRRRREKKKWGERERERADTKRFRLVKTRSISSANSADGEKVWKYK